MKVFKSYSFIIIILISIVVLAQLLRMNILDKHDNSENLIENQYNYYDAIKLSEEINSFSQKLYLILFDSRNQNDLENIQILCDYLKIDYVTASIQDENIDYSLFKTIILLQCEDKEYINTLKIFDFVKEGGNLLYLGNGSIGEDDFLTVNANNFGITKFIDIKETNDINFNTEILMGLKGYFHLDNNDIPEYYNFQYLDVEIDKYAKVHMEDDLGSPLIWEKTLDRGKILVLNIGRYNSKETRGLIAGSLTLLEDLFIYPIINSEVIFIDDFPADYKSDHELIKRNYGRNFERFIKEIWWPDMITLMKKYNLKYTGAYIQTYNDVVDGPFEYNEWTDSTTKELVRNLINHKGEVSFHGYNHQSLLYDQYSSDIYGYNSWSNEEKIIEAIDTALKNFNKIFPNYKFYTYVPPSNLLDTKAIQALRKAMPSLRTISGLYFGEIDDFGKINKDTMLQEVGVGENGIVNLPRLTSEAFLHHNSMYRIASSVTLHGLVNHFMHPDDILDPERSLNLLWKELYGKTEEFFSHINEKYPWIHKDTASTTSEKVKQYHYSKLYYDLKNNVIEIVCDNFHREISLILVTNKEVVSSWNCNYEKIGFNRYLVRLYGFKGSLEVK